MKKWTKDSWRAYPAKHIPEYPDTTELAKHPNVYMKLSGMVVLAAETWSKEIFQPYIDHSIKEFGVKRY